MDAKRDNPNLTQNEKEMILAIVNSEYSSEPGDLVWSFSVCGTKEKAGVVGSLAKKGLVSCQDYDGEDAVALTDKGIAEYKRLSRCPDCGGLLDYNGAYDLPCGC